MHGALDEQTRAIFTETAAMLSPLANANLDHDDDAMSSKSIILLMNFKMNPSN